jgi:5'-3' exonuclease
MILSRPAHTSADEQPSILLVDSFSLLFRGFYATAATGNLMRTSKGVYTNGLYQFTRYLLDAIERFRPTHVACAFDMGKSTFRNELYPEYKANRLEPPAELVPQFDLLWELVDAFDIPCVGKEGYEADDVIGTLASHYSAAGVRVSILTGDGDSLQLIDDNTRVLMMQKGFGNYLSVHLDNLPDIKGVRHPYQIIELKGLMGDASDNIPGCPNVGPKTALKLIGEFETIDGIFARIDEVKGKLKDNLIAHRDQIYLSRDLATIRRDVPLECTLDTCLYRWNPDKLLAKLEELEFRSIIRMLA